MHFLIHSFTTVTLLLCRYIYIKGGIILTKILQKHPNLFVADCRCVLCIVWYVLCVCLVVLWSQHNNHWALSLCSLRNVIEYFQNIQYLATFYHDKLNNLCTFSTISALNHLFNRSIGFLPFYTARNLNNGLVWFVFVLFSIDLKMDTIGNDSSKIDTIEKQWPLHFEPCTKWRHSVLQQLADNSQLTMLIKYTEFSQIFKKESHRSIWRSIQAQNFKINRPHTTEMSWYSRRNSVSIKYPWKNSIWLKSPLIFIGYFWDTPVVFLIEIKYSFQHLFQQLMLCLGTGASDYEWIFWMVDWIQLKY